MDEFEVRDISEDWAVVSLPKGPADSGKTYFMLWVANQPPPARLFAALQQLMKMPRAIAGVELSVRTEPSLGLVLTPVKGWNFEEGSTLRATVDKAKWEINRLVGA